jgi:peptide/nickel transport system permease protein
VTLAALIARRLAAALVSLWGAVTLTFIALQLMPGSTVDTIIGLRPATPQVRAQIIHQYGLDQPLIVQYLVYLGRVARGQLGNSYVLQIPVRQAIAEQIWPTLTLLAVTVVITVAASAAIALVTAGRGPVVRNLSTAAETLGVSMPAFWAGILLLTVFSFRLGWVPAIGATGLTGTILPAITLSIAPVAIVTRVLRQGLERSLEEPFIVTARSRGLRDASVRLRHALRHAFLPVVTLTGWLTGSLIGGAVVVEEVFARPGLGQLAVSALNSKDMPVTMGVVIIAALTYVLASLAVDIVSVLIDPRPARLT